jgi:hypothetical protein
MFTLCGLVLVALVAGTWPTGGDSQEPVTGRTVVQPNDDLPRISAVEFMAAARALAEGATTVEAATPKAAEAVLTESDPVVVAALPPSNVVPESPAPPADTEPQADPAPKIETPDLVQFLDECFVLEVCVDHYLFELYQRSAKLDAHKVHERRKVKVKRKGKLVTVTRRVTKVVSEDFTWKDPHAAEKAGMSLMDYVIGGMDRDFKLRLTHALRVAEKEGHAPGITSGFRDDYRQAIASGTKAASNRSYHGGSLRGGYGHGLAVDIVSTKGATRKERWVTTDILWNWIDANGQQFGVGRPYLKRDPPHVTPIDGQEYVSRRGGVRFPVAAADLKKPAQQAAAKPKLKQKSAARRTAVASAKQNAAAGRAKYAVAKSN